VLSGKSPRVQLIGNITNLLALRVDVIEAVPTVCIVACTRVVATTAITVIRTFPAPNRIYRLANRDRRLLLGELA